MTELESFIAHVKNLKSQNIKQAVFDVNFLYSIVQQIKPPPVTRVVTNSEFDGGSFNNEE